MRFRVLGPLRVRNGAGWVSVPAEQQRVVLAMLLAEAGNTVSTERLADAVWADRPPRRAVNTVQAYVMRLRKLVGDEDRRLIATRGRGYELVLGRDDLDVTVFERLVGSGREALAAGRSDAGAALLAQALELWRGPVFADVPAVPSLTGRVAHLEQMRLAAQEDHLAALLDLNRHSAVVDQLYRLVEENPLRDRRWALLMRALAGSGRRGEALEVFQRARRVLRAELGLEPGPQLRALQRAILAEDQNPVLAAHPVVVPAQLPADATGFAGRDNDLRRLDALLHTGGGRPATAVVIAAIVGTAGVGKTALAVHWAHRVRDRFPDGQLYVNLRGYGPGSPLRPIDALAVFLPALGVSAERVPVDVDAAAGLYRTLLAGRRVLVVLDNAGDPDQVRPLLPGCPGCFVVVTSRERLDGLAARDGAVRLALETLAPAESVSLLEGQLGVDRVRAESEAAAALADLCGRLPLALRIVAAQLSARPDRTIGDYAARLATGERLAALQVNGDPQSAVRVAFGHSYAALPADARRLFRLLGLVPGPDVTAAAAAALTGDSPARAAGLLDRLAGAHLVDDPAPGRYAQHDLLRIYAAEQVAAEEPESERRTALDRLNDYYLRSADTAARVLYPHVLRLPEVPDTADLSIVDDQVPTLEWLDAERPNLVAAVAHAAEHGPRPVAWRLANTLTGYLYMRMYTVDWQVIAGAGLAAARAGGAPRAQAAGHLSLATLARATGDTRRAVAHYMHAHDLAERAGWADCVASALGNLGLLCWVAGRPEEAIAHYTKALAIARRTGWLSGQAANLRRLGLATWSLGRLEESAGHLTEALALHRKTESRSGEARTLCGLGEAYRALGRLDDAIATLEAALALYRRFGDRNRETDALRIMAAVHRDAGRDGTALEIVTAALNLAGETGNRPNEADARNTRGTVLDRLGRHREAASDHRKALRLARRAGNRYTETEALLGLAAAAQHTGDENLARERAEAALNTARRAHFRLLEGDALTVLAGIELDRGSADVAIAHAEQALSLHTEAGHPLGADRAAALLNRIGVAGNEPDNRLPSAGKGGNPRYLPPVSTGT